LKANKSVLITGGSKRIGRSISKYFHDKDYDIVIHFNNSQEEALELCELLNNKRKESCSVYQSNLTKAPEINEFLDKIKSNNKNLEILINNASSFYPTPIESADLENWQDLSFTNLIAPFLLIQGLKDTLKNNNGCIINVSDAIARKGIKDFSLYASAKSGLEALTKSFAKELSPEIRVNAVAPGAILWPELDDSDSDDRDDALAAIPLGRIGTPEDIASAAYFISQSIYMTGQIINVDGGRSLS